jgi:hypothetical protein
VPYGRALLAATQGRDDEALDWLREAIEGDARLHTEAERDELLGALATALDYDEPSTPAAS